jgi:hypothetical protein
MKEAHASRQVVWLVAARRTDHAHGILWVTMKESQARKEVNTVGSDARPFSLVTPVGRHPAGTLVQVTVSAPDPSQLVLAFSSQDEVLTDACVLLTGSIGRLLLRDLGYTGPLIGRPRLAARE